MRRPALTRRHPPGPAPAPRRLAGPWALGLSLAGLAALLSLPAPAPPLDGMPWSNPWELAMAAAVIPFLLLLDRSWLKRAWPLAALGVLVLAKLIVALAAPMPGWQVTVYADEEAFQAQRPAPAWESLWHDGFSAVLRGSWPDARAFPAEWLNGLEPKDRAKAQPVLAIKGWVELPAGSSLAVAARGMTSGKLMVVDAQDREHAVFLAADPQEAARMAPADLPPGALQVQGMIHCGPIKPGWSLEPLLVRDGRAEPLTGRMWQTRRGTEQPEWARRVLTWTARVLGWLTLAWLAGWLVWGLAVRLRAGVLTWWDLAGGTLGLGLALAVVDLVWVACAPLALVAVSCLLPTREERPRSLGLAVLVAAGPGVLCHFLAAWLPEAGLWRFFSWGDDWTTYQNQAREVILMGDFWQTRTSGVMAYQPAYRYVAALLHCLFGHSDVAQRMLDVWAAIAGMGLVAAMVQGLASGGEQAADTDPVEAPGPEPSPEPRVAFWAAAGALVYAFNELGDRFLLHIGLGLIEHAAMLFMLAAAWFALMSRARPGRIWAAGVLAMVGFWLRMDHLGVLAGLGLLAVAEPLGGWRTAWGGLLGRAWAARQRLAIYWGLLALALALVVLRNWLLGGQATLMSSGNAGFLFRSLAENLRAMAGVLSGSETGMLRAGWFMWAGTIAGLLALVCRLGGWRFMPLAPGVALAGLLGPYLVVIPNAYFPRWSVHLLPLACLCLALLGAGWSAWQKERRPSGGPPHIRRSDAACRCRQDSL